MLLLTVQILIQENIFLGIFVKIIFVDDASYFRFLSFLLFVNHFCRLVQTQKYICAEHEMLHDQNSDQLII
jgi:hypothetical protein